MRSFIRAYRCSRNLFEMRNAWHIRFTLYKFIISNAIFSLQIFLLLLLLLSIHSTIISMYCVLYICYLACRTYPTYLCTAPNQAHGFPSHRCRAPAGASQCVGPGSHFHLSITHTNMHNKLWVGSAQRHCCQFILTQTHTHRHRHTTRQGKPPSCLAAPSVALFPHRHDVDGCTTSFCGSFYSVSCCCCCRNPSYLHPPLQTSGFYRVIFFCFVINHEVNMVEKFQFQNCVQQNTDTEDKWQWHIYIGNVHWTCSHSLSRIQHPTRWILSVRALTIDENDTLSAYREHSSMPCIIDAHFGRYAVWCFFGRTFYFSFLFFGFVNCHRKTTNKTRTQPNSVTIYSFNWYIEWNRFLFCWCCARDRHIVFHLIKLQFDRRVSELLNGLWGSCIWKLCGG